MIDVVVFGKPRSYESYEFEFEGQQLPNPINTHTEPVVKHPVVPWGPIYHYYRREGVVGLELYTPCEGFDSARAGIIFGVGLKTNYDFRLTEVLALLGRYWEDLASAFINDNNKFVCESIIDSLRETEWSDEEIAEIRNIVKPEIIANTRLKKELLLLVANDTSDIDEVETSIKKYANVYIANDKNLFKDSINRTAFEKQANSQIYTISGGKIVKDEDERGDKVNKKKDRKAMPKFTTKPKPEESDNPVEDNTENEFEQSDGKTDTSSANKKDGRKIPSKLIAAVATIAIIIVVAWFVFLKIVNKPADRIELAQPESGFVSNGFCLQPKLFHKESERTSTRIEDIKWSIEGDGGKYIEFDTLHTLLKINDKYRYEKPRTESSFIVIARIDEKELARKQYKLEEYKRPKANKATMKPYSSPIQQTFSIDLRLYYNDDSDVSTSKSEIQFDVQPRGIVCIKNDILFVENPPEKDTQITVTAYLDNESIGNQKYIIAKKADSSKSELQGTIYYKFGTNDFAPLTSSVIINTKNLPTAKFEVRDNNGNVLNEGKWHFSSKIYLKSTNDNPTRIDEIRESGKASLTYKKNGKEVATIQFNVEK